MTATAGSLARRARTRAQPLGATLGRHARRLPLHATIAAVCLLWLVPVVGLLVNSVRTVDAIATTGWWHGLVPPLAFTLDNYVAVLATSNLDTAFVNSLLITVPVTVVTTFVAAVTAYAFARMRFPGRQVLFAIVLGLLVLPAQLALVPVLRLLNAVDLAGTFGGIWLVHLGFALPFAVYLLRNFFAALPEEMFEAAEIDGASPLSAFLRIALPTSGPALASLAIFEFIWVWNDLLLALIFLGGDPSVAPLTVAVSNLVSSTTGQGEHLLTAAAFVSMALPLLLFFALQRYFVRGLLAGSVK
jgi:alpha-glucoside transport system permease protein